MSGSSKKSVLFLLLSLLLLGMPLAADGGIPLPRGVSAVPVEAGNEGADGTNGGNALGSIVLGV